MESINFTKFGITKRINSPLILLDGESIGGTSYDETLWIEKEEDWYALSGRENKKILVVTRSQFLMSDEVENG